MNDKVKRTLYMMVGLPGSGKSSLIASQPELMECFVLSTDRYIEDIALVSGKPYDRVFKDNIDWASKKMDEDISKTSSDDFESDVVWNQTNLIAGSRVRKLKRFSSTKFRKVALVFPPENPGVLYSRIKKHRPEKIIPIGVLWRMFHSFEIPDKSEGFDEILFLSSSTTS